MLCVWMGIVYSWETVYSVGLPWAPLLSTGDSQPIRVFLCREEKGWKNMWTCDQGRRKKMDGRAVCFMLGVKRFGAWNWGNIEGVCSLSRCVNVRTAYGREKIFGHLGQLATLGDGSYPGTCMSHVVGESGVVPNAAVLGCIHCSPLHSLQPAFWLSMKDFLQHFPPLLLCCDPC